MADKILIVENEEQSQDFLRAYLRTYDLCIVDNYDDAERTLQNQDIRFAIVNVNLLNRGITESDQLGLDILALIQREYPTLPRVVLTGEPPEFNAPFSKYLPLGVNEVFYKKSMTQGRIQLRDVVKSLMLSIPIPEKDKHFERTSMNWEVVIATVVSVISPYVAALATSASESTGTKLVESVSGNVGKLWGWVCHNINNKGDVEDKKLLDDFQKEPKNKKHQDKLKRTLLYLIPTEDIALHKLTQDLIQELFKLLNDPDCFMPEDLKSICSELDVDWTSHVVPATRDAMARWAVTYARTRRKETELIEAIIKVNPAVLSR